MTTINKTKESANWFLDKASGASAYRKNITGNASRGRDNTVIGKMYFFTYDPKHKATLPVYDKFPLVFPIERYTDGFLGINLHYISPSERAWLLNNLLKFRNNTKMNATMRLRLTYDLLQGTKKLASMARPCVKRYLFGHVRSRFIEILPEEWSNAIELPVADWVTRK